MPNINTLTPDRCAFVFIDHQPYVAFPVQSIAPAELVNNVTALAKVARVQGIPTVLTTIGARGGPLSDPLFQQLQQVFPDVTPIDRQNTNAMATPEYQRLYPIVSEHGQGVAFATQYVLAQYAAGTLKGMGS